MKQLQIFMSARYSRRDELKQVRERLQGEKYNVVARWLDTDWNETERDAIYSSAVLLDLEDVMACDVGIFFTEEPRSSSRGGRHVEFGAAVAMKKYLIVVGPRENIFYHLPSVRHVNIPTGCYHFILNELFDIQDSYVNVSSHVHSDGSVRK